MSLRWKVQSFCFYEISLMLACLHMDHCKGWINTNIICTCLHAGALPRLLGHCPGHDMHSLACWGIVPAAGALPRPLLTLDMFCFVVSRFVCLGWGLCLACLLGGRRLVFWLGLSAACLGWGCWRHMFCVVVPCFVCLGWGLFVCGLPWTLVLFLGAGVGGWGLTL